MSDSSSPPAAAGTSDSAPAETAAAESKTLDQLLAEAQARIDEHKDAWMRAMAEAENVRKRARADVESAHKYAVERMAESLLPVADSLEATLAAAEGAPQASAGEALKGLRDGAELTLKQLAAAFQKAGLAEILPAAGERFDPHKHQAMAAVGSAAEPNSIVAIMQKGYRLHDRVLRPALVTVAKALEN